jgi:hypothetical protein
VAKPLAAAMLSHCQADPRCSRTPCFRVEVHDPPGTIIDDKTANTCADHLGDAVQLLSRWAANHRLSDGYLQVCVIDGASSAAAGLDSDPLPVSFPFASIPLMSSPDAVNAVTMGSHM